VYCRCFVIVLYMFDVLGAFGDAYLLFHNWTIRLALFAGQTEKFRPSGLYRGLIDSRRYFIFL